MDIEEFRTYCLQKKGTTEEFPFDNDTLAFKVMNKIFVLTSLKNWESGNGSANLKCDPEKAIELREKYQEAIKPGYHMNKRHWNAVNLNGANLSQKKIEDLIDHSYELVVSKLTKKQRKELV